MATGSLVLSSLTTGAVTATLSSLTLANVARSELATDSYAPEEIEFTRMRIWDAYQTLITTAASDDLGLTAGAFATGCPYITAGDLKAAGSTTRRCRFEKQLGQEYVSGGNLRVTLTAGMLTTISDGTCTIDLECYLFNGDTLKSGSDLVTTAAQSMNSLTFAALNFELTPTSRAAGDKLDFRISITCADTATVTAVTPAIAKVSLMRDIRG